MSKDRIIIGACFAVSALAAAGVIGYAMLARSSPSPAAPASAAPTKPPAERTVTPPAPAMDAPPFSPAPSVDAEPEASAAALGDTKTIVTITGKVVVPHAKRLGLNLGSRSIYGAAQFIKNLVPNPGFEDSLYGSLLHVDQGADGRRFPQAFWDPAWNYEEYGIGQPGGFWNGARYEVVTGPAKGRTGTIEKFALEGRQNVFYLDHDGAVPQPYDAFMVRTELPGIASGLHMNQAMADSGTTRPWSPGKQSLRLDAASGSKEWDLFLDSEWRDGDVTAGKLLLIEGPWKLSFWAKGARKGERLQVRFERQGETRFLEKTVSLGTDWQEYVYSFNAPPGMDRYAGYGPSDAHPLLILSLTVEEGAGLAWIDDMSLGRTDQKNPTAFVDPLVERLRELHPGILRNWSNQLGDTLENQLAVPWARKEAGFSPKQRAGSAYCYSLHEFLELCAWVDAEPWYVIPPTFSRADLTGLMEYLGGEADGVHAWADLRSSLGRKAPWTEAFAAIHLEFGNEMWGAASGSDPFFGASALGGERLGELASDRLGVLKASPFYRPGAFDLIIGGQYYFPGRQEEITRHSEAHDTIALAPYFGGLDVFDTAAHRYCPLFARPFEDITTGRLSQSRDFIAKAGGKAGLAIYEINFHTTGGNLPLDTRNDFVTGADGALALPLYMLTYQRAFGIRNQCAFTALHYSFDMGNKQYVRLWGMLRDIAATGRKRPTWLGVELANRAIRGDMVETLQSGENPGWVQEPMNDVEHETPVRYVQSFAFREGETYAAVLFNLNLERALDVELQAPGTVRGPAERLSITNGMSDDNEAEVTVSIHQERMESFALPCDVTLPPHSMTVIQWQGV